LSLFKDTAERVKPGYVTQNFALTLKNHGLKKIRFHDLRHPYVKVTPKNNLGYFFNGYLANIHQIVFKLY